MLAEPGVLSGTTPMYRDEQARVLEKYYGYSALHPEQQAAVDAVLGGRDVFVTAPTGFGKTLCFCIPALVRHSSVRCAGNAMPPAITVVVTPLLALMADQVAGLRRRGIGAAMLSSSQTRKENDVVESALASPKQLPFSLIYVTAERVTSASFLNLLSRAHAQSRLALFAIDEAHCISEWGHDFRKSYAQLGTLRASFPTVPIMALTATATPKVATSIISSLSIPNALRVHKSFLRSNIRYRVEFIDGSLCHSSVQDHIVQYILARPGETGIVYVHKRVTVTDMVEVLNSNGISSVGYHAGLTIRMKRDVQEKYEKGEVNVIVATTAFGMGIDKSNVRFVINHSLPGSVEAYFQESGRAGRDGKPSESIIYFGEDDCKMRKYIANLPSSSSDKKTSEALAKRQLQSLNSIISYCKSLSCRRVTLLKHFGEIRQAADICGPSGCDVCEDVEAVKMRMRPVFRRRCSGWRSASFKPAGSLAPQGPAADFQFARASELLMSEDPIDMIDYPNERRRIPHESSRPDSEYCIADEEAVPCDVKSLAELEVEEVSQGKVGKVRTSARDRLREKLGPMGDLRSKPTAGFQSARSMLSEIPQSSNGSKGIGVRAHANSAPKKTLQSRRPPRTLLKRGSIFDHTPTEPKRATSKTVENTRPVPLAKRPRVGRPSDEEDEICSVSSDESVEYVKTAK